MAWPTAGQRAMWQRALRDLATLTHTPLVDDGAGGLTPDTPTTQTVRCRVQPDTTVPTELIVAGAVTGLTYWQVKLPAGTALGAEDTITVCGLVYQVRGVDTGRSNEFGLSAHCVRGPQ